MTNIYFLTSVKDYNKIDSCNQNHIKNQEREREKNLFARNNLDWSNIYWNIFPSWRHFLFHLALHISQLSLLNKSKSSYGKSSPQIYDLQTKKWSPPKSKPKQSKIGNQERSKYSNICTNLILQLNHSSYCVFLLNEPNKKSEIHSWPALDLFLRIVNLP